MPTAMIRFTVPTPRMVMVTEGDEKPRQGEEQVDGAHGHHLRVAATKARPGSQASSHEQSAEHRRQYQLERDARAVHHAAQNVAPELARSEPVRPDRRL